MLVGRAVVAPLHERHRLGQPILIATAAVGSGQCSEFVRVTQGSRERWSPPVFNQPIALMRADDFVVTVDADADRRRVAGLRGGSSPCCGCSRARSSGASWRAFADDPATAALFGVDGRPAAGGHALLARRMPAGLAG